ncbi:prolyl-tRNA editing enzyme YbaK/EbsC (Cys-tRNA(Pro) deacylase) [Chitinivorax tropicus]|uniref:Prolyl-tRNA editing enzyme YbaK/EbsC (Cys-tRNA(Pro) deacylase) n=1 Tax=Chitinivorax tropicus TaxID=714531 RepID=A0A840MMU1_9PROT|nr:YbaK/EbsC family protein [Chitinivorax tropicus]MBB5017513.1 prolyl-tRNA editing enzyme YbaK/EbsC (Cys-tRNA(Pro) deacylase) [Chitinivorax tropicus]
MADSPSQQRVRQALAAKGLSADIVEFDAHTRTSQQAADAIGCQVAQIAKSLVFKALDSQTALLVIASGANRVCERKLAALIGEPIGKADAEFVRQQTGFAIGGVSPVGHVTPLQIVIDQDILQFDTLWAAAGTPNSVFKLTPQALIEASGGKLADIRLD